MSRASRNQALVSNKWVEVTGTEDNFVVRVELAAAPRPTKVFTATSTYVRAADGAEVEIVFGSEVLGRATGAVAVRVPRERLPALLGDETGFVTGLRAAAGDVPMTPLDLAAFRALPVDRIVHMRATLIRSSYSSEDADIVFYRPIPSVMVANRRGRLDETCVEPIVEVQLSARALFSTLHQIAEVIGEPLD